MAFRVGLASLLGKAVLLYFVHMATASERGKKYKSVSFIKSMFQLNKKQTRYYAMN